MDGKHRMEHREDSVIERGNSGSDVSDQQQTKRKRRPRKVDNSKILEKIKIEEKVESEAIAAVDEKEATEEKLNPNSFARDEIVAIFAPPNTNDTISLTEIPSYIRKVDREIERLEVIASVLLMSTILNILLQNQLQKTFKDKYDDILANFKFAADIESSLKSMESETQTLVNKIHNEEVK